MIRIYNPGGVDEFSYEITVASKNNKAKKYSILTLVGTLNVYHSINQKACSVTLTIIDGASLNKVMQVQPGDYINITIYNNANDVRKVLLEDDLRILDISSGFRSGNMQYQQYVINAVQTHAYDNMTIDAQKSMSGLPHELLAQILGDVPGGTDFDETSITHRTNLILSSSSNFSHIDWISRNSVSKNGEARPSNYFFWATPDGKLHWHTLDYLLKEQTSVKTFNVAAGNQKVGSNESDKQRINKWQRLASGSDLSRVKEGLFKGTFLSFDVLNQTLKTSKYDYNSDSASIHALSTNPPMDKDQHDIGEMPETTKLRVRSSEIQLGQPEDAQFMRHNKSSAQLALLTQISYSCIIDSSPDLYAGDLITIIAPDMSVIDAFNRGFDPLLNGIFLVTAVRHEILSGNVFNTHIDICRDGPDRDIYTKQG